MKFTHVPLVFAFSVAALAASVRGADIDGSWQAEFDTQIGQQKYVYDFKADGEKLTGTAHALIDGKTHDDVVTEGTIKGDAVSFVELFSYQGMDLRITYHGKIAGDEIKFTRDVGDMAHEEMVAKRVKEAAKP